MNSAGKPASCAGEQGALMELLGYLPLRWKLNLTLGYLRLLRWRDRWHRVKNWWLWPFRVHVDIYERTRVEWRAFPMRLRIQALARTLQDEIDAAVAAGGGIVRVAPGRIHLTEPAVINGSGVGLHDMSLVVHGDCAIRVPLKDPGDAS